MFLKYVVAVLLLPSVVVASVKTCGDLKAVYKSEKCCGNPSKEVKPMMGCDSNVTKNMVLAAQKEWGDGIVKIAAAKTNGENFTKVAVDHINMLYGYGLTPVLFKPTLAAKIPFRSDFEGALSYFVATNNAAPEDKGFAIKGWTGVRFDNEDIILSGNTAMAMGHYFFTTPEGDDVKVEYSFGYFLDSEGKLRINLHHSSKPYPAQVTEDMVLAAQKEWGDGIVKIAAAHTNGENFTQVAVDHINTLYGYGLTPILFKPTLASKIQFRSDFAGALSYFVATNNAAPEDKGFAIKGWTAVRFENDDIILADSTATAMGNYFFTTPEGTEVKVEYSFGYFLDADGKLRINLHHSSKPYPAQVTRDMVLAAQKEWGDGIVKIAAAKTNGENFTKVAVDHINTLYGYGNKTVLFKPTLASEIQFRSDFEGALSYFVATNNAAPEDKGFAIKGWTAVRFENDDIILSGSTAMAMGNYFFTTPEGTEVKVEYSFGYFLDAEGKLRIDLHHSSKPYPAQVTVDMVVAAQKEWGDGIVKIAAAYRNGENFTQVALDHINTLYGYNLTTVLFKPTLAAQDQFRNTTAEALSYFVATNNAAPEDTGFAIKNWTAVRFENEGIIIAGSTATAMGNYFFTNSSSNEVKVEYSFGYFLDAEKKVRINLHHSSQPYAVA